MVRVTRGTRFKYCEMLPFPFRGKETIHRWVAPKLKKKDERLIVIEWM